MIYHPQGYEPSDAQIEKEGYRAFGPLRAPFVPTAADFKRAGEDMATGDADELRDLAAEVAAYWPGNDDAYCMWWVGGLT